MSNDEVKQTFLENPDILTKYKTAGDIAQKCITKLAEACVEGANLLDLCKLGDSLVEEACKGVYTKGKLAKGIAFPTTVSPNHAICHLSPTASDPEAKITLQNGDLVKVEIGAHIDGYIAQVATTVIVGVSKDAPVTGRKADVLKAGYIASEAALRMMKVGKTNWNVTDIVQKATDDFECKPIEGMISYQIEKDTLDAEKHILLNPTEAQRRDVDTFTFEEGEAYTVDILVSTGEGKARNMDTRTTIHKRMPAQTYSLKMKSSRQVLSEITEKFGNMAFSYRSVDNETRARLGVAECVAHGLVMPYTVLYEKEDAFVAHFQYTVLITATGPIKIVSFPFDLENIRSDKEVKDAEVNEVLKMAVRTNKKKKKSGNKA